jgi:hypothetical protein
MVLRVVWQTGAAAIRRLGQASRGHGEEKSIFFLLLRNFAQLLWTHAPRLLYDGINGNALPLINRER